MIRFPASLPPLGCHFFRVYVNPSPSCQKPKMTKKCSIEVHQDLNPSPCQS